ncbi:MAG: guanitoxin biosynthesis MATE family efflux transporter GntT [Elainellaceae cyanobacterium]
MHTNPSSTWTDFRPRFIRLAIVNVISNLMVPLAGLIDMAFLGHLADIRHLAGVSLATVIFNYIYWSFGFLRMGTTGLTAQAVGRGDRHDVLLTGFRNGILALALGLILLTLQYPLRHIGFALLNATPDVQASGEAFFNARIWGSPAVLLNYVLIGWFLGREKGTLVLLFSAIVNGANVVLDYGFIVQMGWESAGAGWATALSQYLALMFGLVAVSREVSWAQLRAIAPHLVDWAALRAVFTLNGDILVRTFALTTAFAVFTNISAALGTVALATNTLLLQIITLAAYFIDGLAFATESISGVIRGTGKIGQLVPLVRFSGGVSLAAGVMFALPFVIRPDLFFSMLTNHQTLIDEVSRYVLWLLPVLGFGSIAFMLDGYFLGLTEGRILRNAMIVSTLVGFIPVAIAGWYFQNLQILWLSLTSFMLARSITLAWQIPATLKANKQ